MDSTAIYPGFGPVERIAKSHIGRWVTVKELKTNGRILNPEARKVRIPDGMVLMEDDDIFIAGSWYTLYLWDRRTRRFFIERKDENYG